MAALKWADVFVCVQMLILTVQAQRFLQVRGKNLSLSGEKVFLSGMNQAWYSYGSDFGNGNYEKSKRVLYDTIENIHKSGGNTMRMWLHVDGATTPMFNSTGYVTGLDKYILSDLKDFLERAQSRNVFIIFSLWNCVNDSRMKGLFTEDLKLQSYIDNALRPMVRALKEFRSLASWEIMNEPEGCIGRGIYHNDRCFNTLLDPLPWEGGAWNAHYPRYNLSRFISRQASAIHQEDSKALVTVGIWTWYTIVEKLPRTNFYSDECLRKASGEMAGTLDFYQIHTYDTLGFFRESDPFRTDAAHYRLDKPLVIGEFSQKRGGGSSSPQLFTYAYQQGYSGAWSWCALDHDDASDTPAVQMYGMSALKGRNNQSLGGRVDIVIDDGFPGSVAACFYTPKTHILFFTLLSVLAVIACVLVLRILWLCCKFMGGNSGENVPPSESKVPLF